MLGDNDMLIYVWGSFQIRHLFELNSAFLVDPNLAQGAESITHFQMNDEEGQGLGVCLDNVLDVKPQFA